jgi:hypothetical protein
MGVARGLALKEHPAKDFNLELVEIPVPHLVIHLRTSMDSLIFSQPMRLYFFYHQYGTYRN